MGDVVVELPHDHTSHGQSCMMIISHELLKRKNLRAVNPINNPFHKLPLANTSAPRVNETMANCFVFPLVGANSPIAARYVACNRLPGQGQELK